MIYGNSIKIVAVVCYFIKNGLAIFLAETVDLWVFVNHVRTWIFTFLICFSTSVPRLDKEVFVSSAINFV